MGIFEIFLASVIVVLAVLLPQSNNRKAILLMNMGIVGSTSAIMFLNGQPLGSMIYIVAFMGSFSQLVIPNSSDPKVMKLRIGVALGIVALGGVVLYQSVLDLVPIAAFAIARLGDALSTPRLMRFAYIGSGVLFLTFAFLSGVNSLVGTQMVLLTSLFLAVIRYEDLFGLSSTFSAYMQARQKAPGLRVEAAE